MMTVKQAVQQILEQLGPPPFPPSQEYGGFWVRETKRSKERHAFWEGERAMWAHAVEAIGVVAKAAQAAAQAAATEAANA